MVWSILKFVFLKEKLFYKKISCLDGNRTSPYVFRIWIKIVYKNRFYFKNTNISDQTYVHWYIFSVVFQNFSEISLLVKKYEGRQKYMRNAKIRDVIDCNLPLKTLVKFFIGHILIGELVFVWIMENVIQNKKFNFPAKLSEVLSKL